jgi:hypothetical protein
LALAKKISSWYDYQVFGAKKTEAGWFYGGQKETGLT